MSVDLIIGAVFAGLATLLGAFLKGFLDYRKQKSVETISNNDQAFTVYKNIVTMLQENFAKIQTAYQKLEADHLSARELNAEYKSELKYLREKNSELILEAKDMEKKIEQLEKQFCS